MLSSYSDSSKRLKFKAILSQPDVDLTKLREASWTGIPYNLRPTVWKLLFGYLPTQESRRDITLNRKRQEYLSSLPRFYGQSAASTVASSGNTNDNSRKMSSNTTNTTSTGASTMDLLEEDQKNLRQILVDIPRTCPDSPLFHSDEVRKSLERILYVWSVRHPASGYVQGMNDIVTPLYITFLAEHTSDGNVSETNKCDVSGLDKSILDQVEADCFWCLTKLLDGIQDHYTCSQPGVQRSIYKLHAVIQRINANLLQHLESQGLMFFQFAFRWMNCLLLRELPLVIVVRLWDTYLAEDIGGFDTFHVYVCSALLEMFAPDLMRLDSLEATLMFLQDLPTRSWGEGDVEGLLSKAFILQTLFDNSPSHLT